MSTTILNTIKITQPIGVFYIAKISPSVLLDMSFVDRRRIENDDEFLGIQRELKQTKINQIKTYLKSVDATFPNSIILNTTDAFVVNETNNSLELRIDPNTFTIIDGQHRLEGFRDNPIANFELIVSIFKNLELHEQANIFSTINSQQTKVDPSLNLNLELNSKVYTPRKMMIEVAQSFNYDKDSPWFNSIKFGGSGYNGFISLSAFVSPLLDLTFPENEYYQIRNALMANENVSELPNFGINNDRYIFWSLYKRKESHIVYKILYNYFNAIKNLLPDDWLNDNSILNKTTGYNALIKLFKDISSEGIRNNNLSYDYFYKRLTYIHRLNGQINTDNYGASGLQASNELYKQLKNIS